MAGRNITTMREIVLLALLISVSFLPGIINSGLGTVSAASATPSVSVSHSPLNPIKRQTVQITAAASSASGVPTITIFLGNKPVRTCISSRCYYYYYPTSLLYYYKNSSNDMQAYYAVATDNLGNTARSETKTFTVIADITPPAVSVSHSPLPPAANVTITASATDNIRVTSTHIIVDGRLGKSCSSATCVYSTANLSSGNHSYYAVATDSASNVATTPTKTFISGASDMTAPLVSVSHSPFFPAFGQNVVLNASASDASGISYTQIFFENRSLITCFSSPCIYVFSGNLSGGRHTYYAAAADTAGNIGRSPLSGVFEFFIGGCRDTDGGFNVLTQGTVNGTDSTGTPFNYTDYCESAALLREYYCPGFLSQFVYNSTYNCSNNQTFQCTGGRCV